MHYERPQTIQKTITLGLRLWWQNWRLAAMIIFILLGASAIANAYLSFEGFSGLSERSTSIASAIVYFIEIPLMAWCLVALTLLMSAGLASERATAMQALSEGKRYVMTMTLASLCTILIIIIIGTLFALIRFLLIPDALAIVFDVFLFFAFLFFTFTIAFHPAIIIVEKLKAWPTIMRAIKLTWNNKAYLIGVLIVGSILSIIIVVVAIIPALIGSAFLIELGEASMIGFILIATYLTLLRIICTALFAAIILVAYVEMRHREDSSFTLENFRRDTDLA